MGIPPKDIRDAMTLVRDIRIRAIQLGLDPRAIRIAVLFAEKCDREHAEKKLHPVAMAALESIAEELYQLARGRP